MDFKHIPYAKTDLWHYGVRLIYNKRAASRRVKPPPRTKERPTKPQRRASKGVAAKPLGDRLCTLARRLCAVNVGYDVL